MQDIKLGTRVANDSIPEGIATVSGDYFRTLPEALKGYNQRCGLQELWYDYGVGAWQGCQRKIVILRGIPGSGKSTYIRDHTPTAKVCSADHYFEDARGRYNFDIQKIKAAHEFCKMTFLHYLENGVPLIAVDNTNIKLWEFKWYVQRAKMYSYDVEVVRLDIPPDIAAKRCIHGVPEEHIWAKHEQIEPFDGETIREWQSCLSTTT